MKLQSNIFRDYSAEQKIFVRRTLVAFLGILLLSSILIGNLYHLQIVCFEDYKTRSNENRIKLVPIAPSRGTIFDRNGMPLAFNRTSYQAELIPEKIDSLKQTLRNLRSVLDLTDKDIDLIKKQYKCSHVTTPILVKTGLNDIEIARFAVNQYRFPGIEIKGYQYRYYPYGQTLTHVVGYISKINNRDIIRLNHKGKWSNYAATRNIGKLGIENYYEDILHGKTGYEEVEVNNRGQVIRQLHEQAPIAGCDLYLTVDLKLQQYIEKLLTNKQAAVVVSDPRTGEILALVSMPSYNPNLFVNGISNKDYNSLLNDEKRPLYNRALQAAYPPASTIKPYIAISALSLGIIKRNTSLFDPGWWQLPGSSRYYHDWKKLGHGHLNVTKSLEESADTFFYQIAYDMGIDRLSEWMTKFGYGHQTGIDLPEESTGNMPTREWKMKHFKQPWYQGDTIAVGIGQGYWTATPLQMNKAMMILINDGGIKIPHLLSGIRNGFLVIPYRPMSNLSIKHIYSGFWKIVKDGMYGVANRPNGTAHKSFADAPYKIAAKSGTAQIFSIKKNEIYNVHKVAARLRDHKLMTAFAPYDKPRVAVTIILENDDTSLSAGTIMRQILDYIILDKRNSVLQ